MTPAGCNRFSREASARRHLHAIKADDQKLSNVFQPKLSVFLRVLCVRLFVLNLFL